MIIFSLGLALPWPLLLQWLTKNYKKAHPNQKYEDGETGSKPEFESSDEKGEKRRAESSPILTYIIAPLLLFLGLASALVGVSLNTKIVVTIVELNFSDDSVGGRTCLSLFFCTWSSPCSTWRPPLLSKPGVQVSLFPLDQMQVLPQAEKLKNTSWCKPQYCQRLLHRTGNILLGENTYPRKSNSAFCSLLHCAQNTATAMATTGAHITTMVCTPLDCSSPHA